MVLKRYFENMFTKPSTVVMRSRDASLYLFRCIFYMGIRPLPKRYVIPYIVWSCILNTLATVCQPCAFLLSYFTNASEFSPGEFLTSVQVAFNCWSCSVKVIAVWCMLNRLDEANEVLDEMDKRCVLEEEKQKIRVAVALSNRVVFIMMFIYIGYSTSTFLVAVFNGRPPYSYYYPLLDWHASRLQFWTESFLEYFAMCGACYQDVTVDSYSIIYVIILRTHIKILTERIRRLGTKENQSDDDLYNDLINCILDHKNLLRYYNIINPAIGVTIFIQFLVMGIAMGVAFINIILFADFFAGLGICFFLGAILCETTPLSIYCSFLTDDCIALCDSGMQSKWIHTEPRYKKALIYFIQNLQQPIVFKALSVIPINVSTNISIMKFSFSVFTLVKQMNIAERFTRTEGKD